jgi:hypothetical protein
MAFMLPALGGLLGSMIFKKEGGVVGAVPPVQSANLSKLMSGTHPVKQMRMVTQPLLPKMLKRGGKVHKKKKGKK